MTLNLGLRWDVQTPFQSVNDTMSAVTLDSMCGISGLGDGSTFRKCAWGSRNNTGVQPEYIQLTRGTNGYETDWNNFAPNVSIAWRPNVQDGFMRTLLGDPEQATLRARLLADVRTPGHRRRSPAPTAATRAARSR